LQVTGATLTSIPLQTAHGSLAAPAWLFSLADTPIQIARIALDSKLAIYPANPMFQASGAAYAQVSRGTINRDGTTLSVQFIGAPPGTEPCQSEYMAHTVEGTSAVVVIVQPRARPQPRHISCGPAASQRSLTVYLSRSLTERVLLDLSQGWPLTVDRPR
jgi:hypothetical protein